LYTVPEAAAVLRVSTRMVRRLIAQQKIATIHIGRAVRIREEALRALIEESEALLCKTPR
jgi:excisionase family DNA binding protein